MSARGFLCPYKSVFGPPLPPNRTSLSCVAFPVTSGPKTGIRPDCLQVPLRMRAISPRAFDEPGLADPIPYV
jgi:hypothetical protein